MGNGTTNLPKLIEAISRSFDMDGLRLVASDLVVPFDELRGEVLSAKIQALLDYQEQRA